MGRPKNGRAHGPEKRTSRTHPRTIWGQIHIDEPGLMRRWQIYPFSEHRCDCNAKLAFERGVRSSVGQPRAAPRCRRAGCFGELLDGAQVQARLRRVHRPRRLQHGQCRCHAQHRQRRSRARAAPRLPPLETPLGEPTNVSLFCNNCPLPWHA